MHPRHVHTYASLTKTELTYLWRSLNRQGLVQEPPQQSIPRLLELIDPYSHAEVVLCLAADGSEIGINIVEKLIERPIYICARGESSMPLTDIKGNPLKMPLGHRRNEPPIAPTSGSRHVYTHLKGHVRKVDNRLITAITANPKKPGSNAYARFNEYVEGKSVHWHLLNTNVTRADIRWDSSKNFITLVSPALMESDNDS